MKIIISILFSLLLPFIACSQCNFEVNETDKFTGELIQTTESVTITPLIINGSYSVSMSYKQVDTSYMVRMFLVYNISEYKIDTSDLLMLQLSEGSIIKLRPKFEVVGLNSTILGLSGRTGDIYYDISTNDLEKLNKYTIKECRLYYNETYIGIKINKGDSEQIRQDVRCISIV